MIWQHYQLVLNVTDSVKGYVFLVKVNDKELKKDDYVVAYSHGFESTARIHDGTRLIKIVGGVPDDTVRIIKHKVYIDSTYCCTINDKKAWWGPIHPTLVSYIPKGCYFVRGTSYHSFDSRYKEFGLICESQVLGKAFALF